MAARSGSLERELKLAVPPHFRLPPAPALDGLSPRVQPPARFTTDFFDTPDLALAAWGVVLRFRSGEGWQVKLPDTGDGLFDRNELAFDGRRGQVPLAILQLLSAYLRGRPVALSGRMRTVRHRIAYADDAGAERLALVDDRVTAVEPEAGRTLRQLEIELLDANAKDQLEELATHLEGAGATAGDERSKYGWVLGERAPAPEVAAPELAANALLRDAIRAAIGSAVRTLVNADARIRAGGDPEAVHDARVSVRRLRSHLRTFRDQLDAQWANELRSALTGLADALGRVRDTEVLADRLRDAATRLREPDGIADINAELASRLAVERAALAETMSDPGYFEILDRLVAAAAEPHLSGDGNARAAEVLAPAAARAWRRLRRRIGRMSEPPSDTELHAVRIEAKRARYAAESVAPFVGKGAAAFARAAARLQTVLGDHQDAVVARSWLRQAAGEGRIERFTAGQLAALQLDVRDKVRSAWSKAWKAVRRRRPSTW